MKIGDKVVNLITWKSGTHNPGKNEIVEIVGFSYNYLVLKGYEFDLSYSDEIISYNPKYFRPLDYEFAENLLAEISESMKSESIKN